MGAPDGSVERFERRGRRGSGKGGFAEEKSDSAEEQGGFAEEQGGLPEEKGGFAEENGGFAEEKGVVPEEKAVLAEEKGGFAEEKGGFAEEKGGFAEEKGDLPEEKGVVVEEKGGLPEEKGGFAEEKGGFAEEKGVVPEEKAVLAEEKGVLAEEKGGLPAEKGGFAEEKGGLPDEKGGFAEEKGGFAEEKGVFAEEKGVFAEDRKALSLPRGRSVEYLHFLYVAEGTTSILWMSHLHKMLVAGLPTSCLRPGAATGPIRVTSRNRSRISQYPWAFRSRPRLACRLRLASSERGNHAANETTGIPTGDREAIMNSETKGPLAILNLPKKNKDLVTFGKKVSSSMNGNPHFPNPTPSIVDLDAAVTQLDLAETAMGGGPAKTKQRNAARQALAAVLGHLCDHVQGVVEAQTSHSDAAAVITSAGMFVKKVTKPSKAELSVKQGTLSGTVLLVARALSYNAVYYWQWSVDQKSWADIPETMIARTAITGLQPGTVHSFRVRAFTRQGKTEWSQVVTSMVQ